MIKPVDKDDFARQKEIYINGDWFFSSPVPLFLIVLAYLIFISKLGPYLMKGRPAFNLDKILIIYNCVQVLVSCYIFSKASKLIYNYGLFDSTCSYAKAPIVNNMFHCGYCYILAKISELLDTVFFVLRKKQNQVTFLHVYHHTLMVLCSWFCFKHEASYSVVFLGTINTFVHVIMYTYYGLSAIPAFKPYLWWKKYITKLQLTQFTLILAHMAVLCQISNCPPSSMLLGVVIINVIVFIILFSKFYYDSYVAKDSKKIV